MITETRLITFSSEALTEAVRIYAAAFPERMPAGIIRSAALKGVAPPLFAVELEYGGSASETEIVFSPAEAAAMLIHFCRKEKIPLPRSSEKSLAIDDGKVCLVITKTVGQSQGRASSKGKAREAVPAAG